MKPFYPLLVLLFVAGQRPAAQTPGSVFDFGYAQLGTYHPAPSHALQWGANQGALAQYKNAMATAYAENRFGEDDLSLVGFGLALPAGEGAFGVQAAAFGSAAFSQNKIGLAYGRSLGNRLMAGLQFNYLHYHISGYGNAGAVMVEGGVVYRFSQMLQAGVHVQNPTRSGLLQSKEESLPSQWSAGIGYTPSTQLHFTTSIVKAWNHPWSVQAGLQYAMHPKLVVKGGVNTAAPAGFFGAGFQLQNLLLEAAATWHGQLGISPGVMVTYKWKKE